jgi:tetratricopeptide (TPR) repeat protein
LKKKLTIGSIIILFGCVPPADESPSADVVIYENLEDCEPCELLLNFASTNYQNSDWRSAIDNYTQLLTCNCGNLDPENTYKYMAYSYQQLDKPDSAAYVFDQGLKYTPDDVELLKMAGENAGKLSKTDNQIYYFDKILTIEENNPEVLALLSDVYRDQGMFNEQIDILDIILKFDSNNKDAQSDKRAAFKALGKDVSDVDKERWEAEPSNVQYGLDYIQSLKGIGNTEKIIEVCNELLVYEKYNKDVLRSLGDAYLNLYREDDALNVFINIAKIDPMNYKVALDISEILTSKEKYQDALEWAEKAISISGSKGETYYQRAEVYFSVAESCSGDPLQFWDKIVYEISWKDYQTAVNKGFKQAKARRDFLKENYITTSADWFMRPEGEIEVRPQGDCYAWIDKTVQRRK